MPNGLRKWMHQVVTVDCYCSGGTMLLLGITTVNKMRLISENVCVNRESTVLNSSQSLITSEWMPHKSSPPKSCAQQQHWQKVNSITKHKVFLCNIFNLHIRTKTQVLLRQLLENLHPTIAHSTCGWDTVKDQEEESTFITFWSRRWCRKIFG